MKIGFLSMGGITAVDPEIGRIVLGYPGIGKRWSDISKLPNLALLTLAGMTTPGHDLRYLEVLPGTRAEDLPQDFELVAISSQTARIDDACALAGHYRTNGVAAVIGGPHVSYLPEEASRHASAVAIGEGELVWPDIVRDAAAGKLRQRYGQLHQPFDLSQSPMPAFELLEPAKHRRLTVQTSRGCPHRCEFCGASVLLSPKYRQKPAKNVIREIEKIKSIWRHPFIEFVDDNALIDRKYWKDLLRSLKLLDVRWFAETDVSVAEDDELLRLMYESGCAELLIGLESPVIDGLNGLELIGNWKFKALSRHRQAVRKIQSYGIRVLGCFIFGLDGHRPEVADAIYNVAGELELFDVQVTVPNAFPGTPFYARLKQEGRLLEETNWRKCTLFDVNYRPTHMTSEQLLRSFKDLLERLYTEDQVRCRTANFNGYLRAMRRAPRSLMSA